MEKKREENKKEGRLYKRKEEEWSEKERSEERISMVHGKEFETNLSLGKQSMSPFADLGEQQSL